MNINKVKNVDGMVGEGVEFERIRRITGYLVTYDPVTQKLSRQE